MTYTKFYTPAYPTWDNHVTSLFSRPFWVDENPEAVGQHWISKMREYSPAAPQQFHIDLAILESVKSNVLVIYQHLRSRAMPITSNSNHYWPDEALETLRLWANQGFRKTSKDAYSYKEVIPQVRDSEINVRVRKDIHLLTHEELQTYREKVDDILGANSLESHWQELGLLRTSYLD